MSLFFSSNKMWFLVSYLPTFSDDVTLFTVFFFLKASLRYIVFLTIELESHNGISFINIDL